MEEEEAAAAAVGEGGDEGWWRRKSRPPASRQRCRRSASMAMAGKRLSAGEGKKGLPRLELGISLRKRADCIFLIGREGLKLEQIGRAHV